MLKKIFVGKCLFLCLFSFSILFSACSEKTPSQVKTLDGIWYLDVTQSFMILEDKGRPSDFKAERLEFLRGMALVFNTGEKNFSIITHEEERRDFLIKNIAEEEDGSLAFHLGDGEGTFHFKLLDENNLKLDSNLFGTLVFTSEKLPIQNSGIEGFWYLNVEESLMSKPSLSPGEQRDCWLVDGLSFYIDTQKKIITRFQPNMSSRQYALRKVSDHELTSDLDEYGKARFYFFQDGRLKTNLGILPVPLVFSKEKPLEYELEILNGAWKSDPSRSLCTHPASKDAIDTFSIVIDTTSFFVRFIASDGEKTIPFDFFPKKGRVFHARSKGYEGEVLLVPEGSDILKIFSDNLVVFFKKEVGQQGGNMDIAKEEEDPGNVS